MASYCDDDPRNVYPASGYGVFEKSGRELTYASGGHPPVLIFEKNKTEDSKAILLSSANNVDIAAKKRKLHKIKILS